MQSSASDLQITNVDTKYRKAIFWTSNSYPKTNLFHWKHVLAVYVALSQKTKIRLTNIPFFQVEISPLTVFKLVSEMKTV